MAREYPRSTASKQHAWAKLPENQGPRCLICGRKALFKVVVELSWFRGDDEVFKACDEHRSYHAQALLDAKAAAGVAPTQASGIDPENQYIGDLMILQVLADSNSVNDQEREVLLRWIVHSQPHGVGGTDA